MTYTVRANYIRLFIGRIGIHCIVGRNNNYIDEYLDDFSKLVSNWYRSRWYRATTEKQGFLLITLLSISFEKMVF